MTKPVIIHEQCTRPNTLWGSGQITAGMICAGDADGGESTCSGDSGGPLIVSKSSTDDTAVVIGVTSFGPSDGCGTKDLPSVYAYVTNYLDWIQPEMEKWLPKAFILNQNIVLCFYINRFEKSKQKSYQKIWYSPTIKKMKPANLNYCIVLTGKSTVDK